MPDCTCPAAQPLELRKRWEGTEHKRSEQERGVEGVIFKSSNSILFDKYLKSLREAGWDTPTDRNRQLQIYPFMFRVRECSSYKAPIVSFLILLWSSNEDVGFKGGRGVGRPSFVPHKIATNSGMIMREPGDCMSLEEELLRNTDLLSFGNLMKK